jgi:hypothetical protein
MYCEQSGVRVRKQIKNKHTPPASYPNVIWHNFVCVEIEFPFLYPTVVGVDNLLTVRVVILGFHVSIMDVPAARSGGRTRLANVCGLGLRLLVQLLKSLDELDVNWFVSAVHRKGQENT